MKKARPSYPPAARVVAVGAGMARLQIRNRDGRWITYTVSSSMSVYVRDLVRKFEDLAAWARAQALRQVDRHTRARVKALAVLQRKLDRIDAVMKFLHPRRKR